MSAAALIEQAQAAGITLRFESGEVRYRGKASAVQSLIEPLRQHKADLIRWFTLTAANDPEPPTDRALWLEIDREYQRHHVNCPTCIAAGRGAQYGLRCGVGASLWANYQNQI